MKISIYTEGGGRFGYGHVARCLAIAQGFHERDCNVEFYVRGDTEIETLVSGFKCNLFPWTEADIRGRGDLFIFDSYHASMDQMEKIRSGKNALFIDDFHRLDYPQNSWILNACPGISDELYSKNAKLLLGNQYLPLRREFWDLSRTDIRVFNDIKKILVMFGGSDIKNLSPVTIKLLLKTFVNVEVITVQGRGSRSLAELIRLAKIEDRFKILVEPDTSRLIACMREADIAISAAGQTLQELACMGLPTIAIQVAENQSMNVEGWSDSGVILPVRSYNSINFESKLFDALEIFMSRKVRRKYSFKAMQFVDGQGPRRLVRSIINNVIY